MKSGLGEIDTFVGDVWELATQAIVSPVHCELLPVAPIGVEVVRRAGYEVDRELRANEPLAMGHVCMTDAGTLEAEKIIHIAVTTLSRRPTIEALREALRNALLMGHRQNMRSIAIPAAYIEPGELATSVVARCIVESAADHLRRSRLPNRIVLVVPTDYVHNVFLSEIDRVHFGELPA